MNEDEKGGVPLAKMKTFGATNPGDSSPERDHNSHIEDFTKKSVKNFKRFLSLQNEGSLKLNL